MSKQFHFTSSPTASLFDIWAEGSLRSSIKPAWEYLCKVLQSKYPSLLRSTLKYSDEIYYAILLLVEEYNLRKKSASITESFYELTRQCSSPKHSLFFRHAKLISLLSIVVLPYIMGKLEKIYQTTKEKMAIDPRSLSILQKQLLNFYPKLATISKWLQVANYICYIFNFTGYGNPLLFITRMQLKYGSNEQSQNCDKNDDRRLYLKFLSSISNTLSSMFMKLVPFFLHSLQFADLLYQPDMLSNVASAVKTSFAAPKIPQVISTDVKLPPSEKQCPLCRQSHHNPTTLSISGFVFCYSCIHQYVQMFKCCPITYRPCDLQDLVSLRTS